MNNLKLLSLLLLAFLVFNCSSDDNAPAIEQDTGPSATHQLLMSGKWYLVPNDTTDIAVYLCKTKTYYHFTTSNNLINERFNLNTMENCESSGEQEQTYELKNEDSILKITNNSITTTYSIQSITEDELIIDSAEFINGPTTFKKQV